MDRKVFPILLSMLCSTVLSVSVEETDLENGYGERLPGSEERVMKLISQLLSDKMNQDGYGDGDEVIYPDVNIPMLDKYPAENVGGDDFDVDEAKTLILKSLSSNGIPLDTKRAGSLDCLEQSCEDVERRRQPSRNAHYRTLPFGKRVQRQALSTVRNPRKTLPKKAKGRIVVPQRLLPFGK